MMPSKYEDRLIEIDRKYKSANRRRLMLSIFSTAIVSVGVVMIFSYFNYYSSIAKLNAEAPTLVNPGENSVIDNILPPNTGTIALSSEWGSRTSPRQACNELAIENFDIGTYQLISFNESQRPTEIWDQNIQVQYTCIFVVQR